MLNSFITDPNIAYLLIVLGIWGLFLELTHPGYVLPGVTGVIAILFALYAFQLLPINYTGLGLMLLGMAFMIAEAFLPTFGVLGIGGVIAFVLGSAMLVHPTTPGHTIALPLIIAISIVSAAFFLLIINLAIKSRARPIVSGHEELLGKIATVISVEENKTWTRVHGELWQARAAVPLKPGQKIKIVRVEDVILIVEPI
jgi:membrane-bound serine protease (ClpP class)